MATVHDVAAYILKKLGRTSALKFQKLVYYSQAWSLVWDDKPLFRAKIEAWAGGPVVPALYALHRGKYAVHSWPSGDPDNLQTDECKTVDAVVKFYGDKSPQWLSDLTHMEPPWLKARKGVKSTDSGKNEITLASMAEYYSNIRP